MQEEIRKLHNRLAESLVGKINLHDDIHDLHRGFSIQIFRLVRVAELVDFMNQQIWTTRAK